MRTLLLLLGGLLAGCTVRLGDLTFASTKNLGYTYPPLARSVRGENCAYNILGIPLGTLNPNIQDAVDEAVRKTPNGDMLINASFHNDILIAILYGYNCIRVDGDVVNTAGQR
ncbi:MAG: hypothetical protein HY271_04610 [Deltaproteobacteria bacterium]|nr:hypothetical protein [Deltaproteobacteria bacterium]